MKFWKLIFKSIILIFQKAKIYKENPVCNVYYIVSELEDVLKIGYFSSNLYYDTVGWFVNEVKNLEKNGFLFQKQDRWFIDWRRWRGL